MRNILKFFVLSLTISSFVSNAQDTQNWYADDIYYSSDEKEVNYLEFIYEQEDAYDTYSEDSEDYYEDEMSYSMRISRFHRDYYGSAINFNYGYFHDPYGFEFGFGCMPVYSSFYNNNFYGGYYGYNNFYNPWNSPWNNSFYAWNNPYGFNYGFGFGYGYGYSPYMYDLPFVYSTNSTYGHRESMGNNLSSSSIRNNQITGGNRNPELAKRNVNINRSDFSTSSKKSTYNPKKVRSSFEFNTSKKHKSSTGVKSKTSIKSSSPKINNSSSKKSSSRSKSNYTPRRSSSNNRSSNTNRSTSTPSRRPR